MRKALSRFDITPNVEQSKLVIESAVMNMARAYYRSSPNKGEFSENMQYFFMYALGALKSQIINIPQVMQPSSTVDIYNYQRFIAMQVSPEELMQ